MSTGAPGNLPRPAENMAATEYSKKLLLPEKVKTPSSGTNSSAGFGGGKFRVIKSYVSNKYVKDGEFFVELVWWQEGLNGGTPNTGSGSAIVRLPSKYAK